MAMDCRHILGSVADSPAGGQRGAKLTLSFTLPNVEIGKLKGNGITASINGAVLKTEKYETPGSYVFTSDVPTSVLQADTVKVDFALDKTMRPDGDKRELGIIANSVGISSR